MALPNDILRTIADLERRLANLETSPQPPNIALSGNGGASFLLGNGGMAHLTYTLSPASGGRLFGMPATSIYKNSIETANQYPSGTNWAQPAVEGFTYKEWIDWGTTDNNNIKYRALLINKTGADLNLIFRINIRYLQRNATL